MARGHTADMECNDWRFLNRLSRVMVWTSEQGEHIPLNIEGQAVVGERLRTPGMDPSRVAEFKLPVSTLRYGEQPFDANDPRLDKRLPLEWSQISNRDRLMIQDTYERIRNPEQDGESARSILTCHNALFDYRHGYVPDASGLVNLMIRSFSWSIVQYPVDSDPYTKYSFIHPDAVLLWPDRPNRMPANRFQGICGVNVPPSNNGINGYRDFAFTIHLIRFGIVNAEYALMIRNPTSDMRWYFDCGDLDNRARRFFAADRELTAWLQSIGIPPTPHYSIFSNNLQHAELTANRDGLQLIAHVLAFLRYGVVGWEHIPFFQGNKERVRIMVLESLHSIMGLEMINGALRD